MIKSEAYEVGYKFYKENPTSEEIPYTDKYDKSQFIYGWYAAREEQVEEETKEFKEEFLELCKKYKMSISGTAEFQYLDKNQQYQCFGISE